MRDRNLKREIPRTPEIKMIRLHELEMWEKVIIAIVLILILAFSHQFYDGMVPII